MFGVVMYNLCSGQIYLLGTHETLALAESSARANNMAPECWGSYVDFKVVTVVTA